MVSLVLLLLSLQANGAALDQFGKNHNPQSPGEGITVIDFAASWCKPCWKALPHVNALAEEGVKVLVVSVDKKESGRDKLVKRLNLTVPVIWDKDHLWAEAYQPEGMPSTLIVDASGKILYRHTGFDKAKWQVFLTRLKQLREAG